MSSFGKYELLGVIARGGMGVMYLAVQRGAAGFSKVVAIKVGLPHLSQNETFRRSFLNEAQVAARLEHPNVVSIHEFGEVNDNYFIAMEYLPGEDLTGILRQANIRDVTIPLPIVGAIMQQSASALHYAHELKGPDGVPANFIHRDVSPANILVTYHGVTKLLDFGIAKARTLDSTTRDGAFKGKLMHCAPEQLMQEKIDRRSDVFALGIIFWELLTARQLFSAKSDAAIMDAVRRRRVPPPSQLRPGVSPDLDRIALKALARRREDRFQSAMEFGSALDAYFNAHGSRASQQEVGEWLSGLFGEERAQMKTALSQGRDLERAPQALAKIGSDAPAVEVSALRSGWSTDLPAQRELTPEFGTLLPTRAPSAEYPVPSIETARTSGISLLTTGTLDVPKPASLNVYAVLVAAALVGVGLGLYLYDGQPGPNGTSQAASALGSLRVTSTPSGAAVAINGEPTGHLTPASIGGVVAGEPVTVRVTMNDYRPVSQKVAVEAGGQSSVDIVLKASVGYIVFKGLGRRKLYVDDELTDASIPVRLPVGQHALRVESFNGPEVEREISVEAGEQTVTLGNAP